MNVYKYYSRIKISVHPFPLAISFISFVPLSPPPPLLPLAVVLQPPLLPLALAVIDWFFQPLLLNVVMVLQPLPLTLAVVLTVGYPHWF